MYKSIYYSGHGRSAHRKSSLGLRRTKSRVRPHKPLREPLPAHRPPNHLSAHPCPILAPGMASIGHGSGWLWRAQPQIIHPGGAPWPLAGPPWTSQVPSRASLAAYCPRIHPWRAPDPLAHCCGTEGKSWIGLGRSSPLGNLPPVRLGPFGALPLPGGQTARLAMVARGPGCATGPSCGWSLSQWGQGAI
jgi:hypothetical protein